MRTMKAKPRTGGFPVTSVRIDPELVDKAVALARKNKRAGMPEDALYKILTAALADYLRKRGA